MNQFQNSVKLLIDKFGQSIFFFTNGQVLSLEIFICSKYVYFSEKAMGNKNAWEKNNKFILSSNILNS